MITNTQEIIQFAEKIAYPINNNLSSLSTEIGRINIILADIHQELVNQNSTRMDINTLISAGAGFVGVLIRDAMFLEKQKFGFTKKDIKKLKAELPSMEKELKMILKKGFLNKMNDFVVKDQLSRAS
jgi:hypothetical protein